MKTRTLLMSAMMLCLATVVAPPAAATFDLCTPTLCVGGVDLGTAGGCPNVQRTYTGNARDWYFVVAGQRDPIDTSIVSIYYKATWNSVYTYGRLANGQCGVVQAFCDIQVSDGSHFHADVVQGRVVASTGEWKGVAVVLSSIACNSNTAASIGGVTILGQPITGRTV